jgi:hypothetical protein
MQYYTSVGDAHVIWVNYHFGTQLTKAPEPVTEPSIRLSLNAQLCPAMPSYGEAGGEADARLRLRQETWRPGLLPLFKIGRAAGATADVWLGLRGLRGPRPAGPIQNNA